MWCKAETKKNKNKKTNKIKQGMNWTAVVSTREERESVCVCVRESEREREKEWGEKDITKTIAANCA